MDRSDRQRLTLAGNAYERAWERAAGREDVPELARARLALVELLVQSGYEPEPPVRQQVQRDQHLLRTRQLLA